MHLYLTVLTVVAGLCLAWGFLFLFIGLRRKDNRQLNLTFALFALSYGAAVLTAIGNYSATSVTGWLSTARWDGVFAVSTWVFLLWHIAVRTGVRPRWFLRPLTAVFIIAGIAHVSGPSLSHGEIFGLAYVTLPWGEQLAYVEATDTIWLDVFLVANLVAIGFILAACFVQFRRGERRPALVLGAGTAWFIATMIVDILVDIGLAPLYLGDFGFLGLAITTSLLMTNEVIRAEEELTRYRQSLEEMVEKRTEEIQRANEQLAQEIADRLQIDEELQRVAYERGERVKHLDCLFGISDLAGQQDISLEEILQGTAALIPGAWQNPALTVARILLEGTAFETEGFKETPWCLARDLLVRGDKVGTIEVSLLEAPKQTKQVDRAADSVPEDPFLPEERRLLDAVAERLGRIIQRMHTEEALRESEARYRHLVEDIQEIIYAVDTQGQITYISPTVESAMGYRVSEVVGRSLFEFVSDLDRERLAASFRQSLAGSPEIQDEYRLVTKSGEIRWVKPSALPVVEDDRIVGLQGVLTDITDRIRAEEALRRRLEELTGLNRIAHTLAAVTELPAALEQVSEEVRELLAARCAHIIWSEEEGSFVFVGPHPASAGAVPRPIDMSLDELPIVREVLSEAKSRIISDIGSLPLSSPVGEFLAQQNVHSVLLAPLVVRGRAMGLLVVATDQRERRFTSDEVLLAETTAADIAAAIEGARLFEQAQAAAAAEERSRLARDLHDAVTQTVYSATLIAESLPQVWERDPGEGRRNLLKLRQLARGALSEMRTMLFELRPSALEAAELGSLLEYMGNALTGRTRIPVDVAVKGEMELPVEVKVALYRIAQEAFSNIAKHSEATQVKVALQGGPERTTLTIEDNGRGFIPASVPTERMGLQIMRERAKSIGAGLKVRSASGQGTKVAVVWPADEEVDQ